MRKLKLLFASLALLVGSGTTWADKVDVTSQLISNPNFEGTSAITSEYKTYHKDVADNCVSGLIAINGWTPVNETADAHTGGPISYGSSVTLAGAAVPAKPEGGANETALGLVAVWEATAQYLSDEVLLPAGEYTITVKYYNTVAATIKTNLFGFKETSGTTHYGTFTSLTANAWTTETVNFTLASATKGQFSVGLAMDGGNAGAPHVFIDNIKVEYEGEGVSAPSLGLRADVGEAVSTLTNFIPASDNYTLEVEGAVGTPITIAAEGISYTPTTNATVRFAKSNGVVYVYEDVDFMTVVATGKPAFSPNIFTDDAAKANTNLLENGSFETLGDLISGQTDRYKFGTPWTSNVTEGGTGVRINTSGTTHRMCWRGRSNSNYFGQAITGLKPNRTYQVSLRQVDHGNGKATWKVGLGTTAGSIDLGNVVFTLGGASGNDDQNGVWYATFKTPSTVSESTTYYFTFLNGDKVDNTGDPLTQIDWIALAEQEDLPITGATSAKYTADGAFRPATPKDAYDEALAAATAALGNDDYVNVAGTEKASLAALTTADEPTTADAYNQATSNLQTATESFIAAKSSYDAYATAKAAAEVVTESDVLSVVIAGNSDATAADALAASLILPKAFAVKAATAAVPITTNFVVNGTFDSNKDGWTATGGFQNNQLKDATQGTLNKFWENWNGSAKINKMYQAIENIPNGTYRLNISAFVNNLDADNQYVFANNDKTSLTSGATTGADYEVYTVVTNNQIEIGLEQTTATANWMGIDNVSLHYYGAGDVVTDAKNASHKPAWLEAKAAAETAYTNSDYTNVIGSEKTALETEIGKAEPSTAEGYDAAAVALNNATATFTAAKANYDALVAEIENAKSLGVATATAESYAATSTSTAASALANVQALNVEEYTAVTTKYDTDGSALFIPSWDNSNFGSLTEQHWSGEAREYFDKWSGSAFNSSISKTVTLPEGHYAFYAAGRGQIDSPSAVTLKVEISGGATLTQSYNMKGDTGKGIDTSGAANFGEGTFANGGAGRGWEWRYIAFDLDAETSVTLSIEGSGNNSWVGACDTKLLTYENIEVSRRLYNTNKDAAIAARDNSDYVNVAGTERTTLVSAINASVIETYAGYNTAAENLAAATSAFTAAKSSYDAWVAVKDEVYADDKPYASATKYAAIATAQEATPTTAADAATATNAVVSAYRKYVESNAMAEGVDGAVDKTSLISDPNMDVTYDGTAHTFGAWQVFSQTDGTISLKTESDEPLTDSEGNKYKYADIWKSDNNGGIKQTLSNLPAGKYLLTVAARAQNAADATFGLFAGSARTEIARIDNVGGEFGNGWNDAYVVFVVHETSDVEIGVQSGNGKTMWWGATRFRLVRLGDAFEPVEVTAAGYKTYCSKNDLDFTGMEVKAYKATATDKKVTFTPVTTVPAGEGVLLKGEGTFNVPVTAGVTAWAAEANAFIGVTSETEVDGPIFVLMNGTSGVGFYKATAAKFTVGANTAYLPESAAASRMFIGFDDEEEVTGIRELNSSANKGAIYNMNGVRVEKAKKGLYIQNGKKFVVK